MSNTNEIVEVFFHYGDGSEKNIWISDKDNESNLITYLMKYEKDMHEVTFDKNYKCIAYERYKRYPYIQYEENVRWNVPYEDVSIEDFIRTFPEVKNEGIHAYIDNRGGAGNLVNTFIQEWCILINHIYTIKSTLHIESVGDVLDWLMRIQFICEGLKYLKKSFSSKIEEKPSVTEIEHFIRRKKLWDVMELAKLLNGEEKLIKNILMGVGYVSKDGRLYRYSGSMEEQKSNNKSTTNYMRIDDLIDEINENIIYYAVLFNEYSDIGKFDSEIMKYMVVLDKYASYIKWDKNRKCIKIVGKSPSKLNKKEQGEIVSCLTEIDKKIRFKCTKLEELDSIIV